VSRRAAAWIMAVATTALVAGSLMVGPIVGGVWGWAPGTLASSVVGALIVGRHPRHTVGWILCLVGLFGGFESLAFELAEVDPTAALWVWMAWGGLLLTFFNTGLIVALPAYFPTGRLLTPRWRAVPWLLFAGATLINLEVGLIPGPMSAVDVPNPAAVPGLTPVLEVIGPVGFLSFLAGGLGSFASMVVRFRRSRGIERQQLKWMAWAAGLLAGSFVVAVFWDPTTVLWAQLLVVLGFTAIPVAAGIAILRYRLYDIDLVINRTLVYAALTGLLGLVYVGSVVLLGGLLPVEGNDLAVAGSTLAVAALFSPARRRIQAFVDRRFYRSRYDAARTVDAFSARLRDEVDLDTLSSDLQAVVRDTLQPASVSMWIREARQ
jgi:hypothetical protein